MTIKEIFFKNINNLKGENRISFGEYPLADAGIYAIVGPTGSGKSTILDVITLALFNKIPRYNSKISKSSIEREGAVMTHNTDEAIARITYEVRNKTYTSEWILSRARTGNLKEHEMFVYDEAGVALVSKKSEVPPKNEEIIGLSYDEFVKAIILSQGEFSKFLKANKNERGELLENLTGTKIYRKLGATAYEKFAEAKQNLTIAKSKIEEIICLSNEEVKHLHQAKEEKEKVLKKLQVDLSEWVKQKQKVERLDELESQLNVLAAVQENLQEEQKLFLEEEKRLVAHEEIAHLLPNIGKYIDQKNKLKKVDATIVAYEDQQVQLTNKVEKLIHDVSLVVDAPLTRDSFFHTLNVYENQVLALDQEMSILAQQGKETRTFINSIAEKNKLSIPQKVAPQEGMKIVDEEAQKCTRLLNEMGINQEVDVKILGTERDTISKRTVHYRSLKSMIENVAERKQQYDKLINEIELFTKNSETIKPALAKQEKLSETTRELVESIRKEKENKLLIASLQEHRHHLVDGESCPLCGSTEHPFTDHLPDEKSDIDQRLTQKIKEQKIIDDELSEIKKSLSGLTAKLKLTSDNKTVLEAVIQKEMNQIKAGMDALSLSDNIQISDIKELIQQSEHKVHDLNQALELIPKIQSIESIKDRLEKLNSIFVSHTSLKEERSKKYKLDTNIKVFVKDNNDQFNDACSLLDKLSGSLGSLKEEKTAGYEAIDQLNGAISPKINALGYSNIEETQSVALPKEVYDGLIETREKLTKKKVELDTRKSNLNKELEQEKEKAKGVVLSLDELRSTITKNESLRDESLRNLGEISKTIQRDEEERKRKAKSEKEIMMLEKTYDQWSRMNKLIGSKTGAVFSNFAQGITLQNLLVYANRRMQKLSDRYLITKPIDDGPLNVVDVYQGNIIRSVTTLSGGESFLISLALALSLSDMASRNVRLECLFIDEGFGTLDLDTLDIAMRTLEKLQSESQKSVGVISHVESLKERINVQIQLVKNSHGYSKIEVVA